jgi:hypothetical protein
MDYEPIGKGVLISFNAKWKEDLERRSNIDISKLSKDLSKIVKNHMESRFPNLYIEARKAGDDANSYSLYVESMGVKLEDLDKQSVYGPYGYTDNTYDLLEDGARKKFYDIAGEMGASVSFSNLKVRKAELEKVMQIYGQPEITVKKK